MARNKLFRWRRPKPPGGLTCAEMVELVTAYLEDALPAADRKRFEAHIALCDACTAYLEQMRMTLRILGRLEPADLSADAERELLQALRDWRSRGAAG